MCIYYNSMVFAFVWTKDSHLETYGIHWSRAGIFKEFILLTFSSLYIYLQVRQKCGGSVANTSDRDRLGSRLFEPGPHWANGQYFTRWTEFRHMPIWTGKWNKKTVKHYNDFNRFTKYIFWMSNCWSHIFYNKCQNCQLSSNVHSFFFKLTFAVQFL